MKVVPIPLDKIELGQRLREIDEAYATILAASFEANGQRTPIEVRAATADGTYRLIAGAHRVAAARMNRTRTILAVIKDVGDDEAELLEIDENLIRHDLTALDRATFLAKRKALYLKMYPETAAGGARRAGQNHKFVVLTEKFSEATAKRLGVSDETIDRAIRRFNKIAPEVRAKLSGTPLANKGVELDTLAKIEDPAIQLLVAEMVLDGTSRTVADALRVVTNTEEPPRDPAEAEFLAFRRRWEKTGGNGYAAATKGMIRDLIIQEFGLVYPEPNGHGQKDGK